MKNKLNVIFAAVAALMICTSISAAPPAPRDHLNETVVKGNCNSGEKNCQSVAVAFRLGPNIPGSGPEFANSECAERRMLPTDVKQVWTRSGGRYGHRIWMVMCEKP